MVDIEPVVLTSAQAQDRSAALGPWLAARGAQAGDRLVLAVSPYRPATGADLICAVYGALRHGVIPVVLDPSVSERELYELIEDADPLAVIASAPELARALGGRPTADPVSTPLGRPMHYTSGTTGRRKGVFGGVLTPDAGAALWEEERALWAITADDVHIVMSPLHHSAPLRFALVTLLAGGSVVLPGRFEPGTFAEMCENSSPTCAFSAPAQLHRLRARCLEDAGFARRLRRIVAGFMMLAHAGAPCPEPVKRWLLSKTEPDRIWEFYGSTEGQFTACSGADWLQRPGTVGRARPGRTLVIGDDGRIWCAVPPYARFSYWNDPVKTAAAWRDTTAGPAFTAGDAGFLDDDGYLFLHGRRDDLIISGGVNVYPAEVERVLSAVPGVDDVAVFGVPDDRWGQRVEAAITGTAETAAVMAFAAAELPATRRPKRVHHLEDLPRTSTGKILRRSLPDILG